MFAGSEHFDNGAHTGINGGFMGAPATNTFCPMS